MIGTGVLRKLIAAKKDEIERYKQLLKNQSAESEDRLDMLERFSERMSRAVDELAELESNLELLEKYANER